MNYLCQAWELVGSAGSPCAHCNVVACLEKPWLAALLFCPRSGNTNSIGLCGVGWGTDSAFDFERARAVPSESPQRPLSPLQGPIWRKGGFLREEEFDEEKQRPEGLSLVKVPGQEFP